jgi:hypothetical protein
MPSPPLTKNQIDGIKLCKRDPVAFARTILREDLWTKQREILSSLVAHRRVAVKACHASGKTFVAAAAVLWWLAANEDGIAITTAPTWTQVKKILWGEIRATAQRATGFFPDPNVVSLQISPNRYALGLATNQGVNFQGFHGKVLIVMDEAPGIEGDIWEAIEGIRAGGDVRVLALGNPVVGSGSFFDVFTSGRSGWHPMTISAWDTPNLAGLTLEALLALGEDHLDRNPRPYLTTRRWVKEKYLEWGPNHPLWESRVLGNFPKQAADALISLAWCEAASKREIELSGPEVAGLDIAGPGEDETVLCIRKGGQITKMKAWSTADSRGEVLAELRLHPNLEILNGDTNGIGYNFLLHLADKGIPVCHVNVGKTPRDQQKFANLKAELYWGLRMKMEAGEVGGLTDDVAIGQLAGIRYKIRSDGKTQIETKDEARARGVKSPDRAEAVMLAFAELGPPRNVSIESLTKESAFGRMSA